MSSMTPNTYSTQLRVNYIEGANNCIDGEHKICVTIADGVYDAMSENLKQLRVEVIYQNEYRKSKGSIFLIGIRGCRK
jgi:hypothetical protein